MLNKVAWNLRFELPNGLLNKRQNFRHHGRMSQCSLKLRVFRQHYLSFFFARLQLTRRPPRSCLSDTAIFNYFFETGPEEQELRG